MKTLYNLLTMAEREQEDPETIGWNSRYKTIGNRSVSNMAEIN